jgi:hypothetical protein
MASARSRSAALLISVYVDAAGGASWHAQLRSFSDPASGEIQVERASDKDQVVCAVRRWLEAVLEGS